MNVIDDKLLEKPKLHAISAPKHNDVNRMNKIFISLWCHNISMNYLYRTDDKILCVCIIQKWAVI